MSFCYIGLVGYIITITSIYIIVYSCTWIFQIIYSIKYNTRPSFPFLYIINSSLYRIFEPIYINTYSNNIYGIKPNYIKLIAIIVIILLEEFILIVQKIYGANSIIPKCLKHSKFNYYTDTINIEEHITRNKECPICLENLSELNEEANIEIIDNSDYNKSRILKFCNSSIILYIKAYMDKIFSDKHKRKNYMITPCDHIFHSKCLEEWMKIKYICPYCKSQIPEI